MESVKRAFLFLTVFLLVISFVSALSVGQAYDGLDKLVTGYVVGNKEPSVVLTKPSDNEVVNNPVIFTWSYFDPEDDRLLYSVLQLDDSRNFFSPMEYVVQGTEKKLTIPIGGDYYWRVLVVNEFGKRLSESNRIFLSTDKKVCSDGSLYFQCSDMQPLYCDSGILKNKCDKCGCPEGGICQQDGTCFTQRCGDGTLYGECSTDKPEYCFNGVLRNVCNLCGCPNNLVCLLDGSCAEEKIEIVEISPQDAQEAVELTILEKIADFFKRLFTGKGLYE